MAYVKLFDILQAARNEMDNRIVCSMADENHTQEDKLCHELAMLFQRFFGNRDDMTGLEALAVFRVSFSVCQAMSQKIDTLGPKIIDIYDKRDALAKKLVDPEDLN